LKDAQTIDSSVSLQPEKTKNQTSHDGTASAIKCYKGKKPVTAVAEKAKEQPTLAPTPPSKVTPSNLVPNIIFHKVSNEEPL
jgi:hypothetical protein